MRFIIRPVKELKVRQLVMLKYFTVGSASPEIPPIEILRIIMKDQNVTDDYLATIDSLEMLDEIRSGFRNKSEEVCAD